MTQRERYEKFLALHQHPQGFLMPNAWDAASALLLKEAGFEALGTSSAALASSLGVLDGRHAVSREDHLTHAALLGRVSELPINGDFEDGYGASPEEVAYTVNRAIEAGLAGIGIEDTSGDPARPIRDFDDAVARISAAARAAKGRIVLTGRTDNYLHGFSDLDDVIRRLTAFAEAGADVLYAPYPTDTSHVAAIVRAVSPKPVNLLIGTMAGPLPLEEIQKAGIKRVSLGGALYLRVMGDLRKSAQDLLRGDLAAASAGMPFRDLASLISKAPTL